MKITARTVVSLVLLGVCSVTSPLSLKAAPINTLVPTKSEIDTLPKFGFSGETIPGVGDQIMSLTPNGRFARAGIEVGDIILSVNGFALTESGTWHSALIRARSQGAKTLRLRIRDVRTNTVRSRDVGVNFSGVGKKL